MFDEIRNAIRNERRHVHRLGFLTPNQADAMIRVEIDRRTEDALLEYLYNNDRYAFMSYRSHGGGGPYEEREGPATIDGIPIYTVNRLAPPGWRVINPFQQERKTYGTY